MSIAFRLLVRPKHLQCQVPSILSRSLRYSTGDSRSWLEGLVGSQYKHPIPASEGSNWIGEDHPFPLNPSFKPPKPISNNAKNEIYALYIADPVENSIPALSTRYGISLKRVDAILRLKGLEESWEKGKELQTSFQAGIEAILGTNDISKASAEDLAHLEFQAAEMQDEFIKSARARYQRLYWEPLPEGNERSLVVPALDKFEKDTAQKRIDARNAKSNPTLLTGQKSPKRDSTPAVVVYQSNPNRPAIVFKDVGGKFMDVRDRNRRIRQAERRKSHKLIMREKRAAALR